MDDVITQPHIHTLAMVVAGALSAYLVGGLLGRFYGGMLARTLGFLIALAGGHAATFAVAYLHFIHNTPVPVPIGHVALGGAISNVWTVLIAAGVGVWTGRYLRRAAVDARG
ncbi:hypothetical protein SH611_07380 [Geminicoccaceae bacterium 1502E]|nr:hypothetical protein [Geminicoccaceae bacterium 1502E]